MMDSVTDKSARREGRHWKNLSRAERYAVIQHHVLIAVLYVVVIYLVATRIGAGTAAIVFGGGVLATVTGTLIGLRRRRTRNGRR